MPISAVKKEYIFHLYYKINENDSDNRIIGQRDTAIDAGVCPENLVKLSLV